MRPLLAAYLDPVTLAASPSWSYDPTTQVSRSPSGRPVALLTSLETATRVAREDPDEDPTGYDTLTKVSGEDPDEAAWAHLVFGDPVAGAMTF